MVVSSEMSCVQCTIVGDKKVGKSTISRGLGESEANLDMQNNNYESTIFDNIAGTTNLDGEDITINLFDCSSEEEHSAIREFAYKDSNVFILCYSVIDRTSLMNIRDKWIPEIKKFLGKKIKLVVVGTQTDIRDSVCLDQDPPVSKTEGADFSRQIGADYFMECSSAFPSSFTEIFKHVAKIGKKTKRRRSPVNLVRRLLGTN
ncbi:rho-related protein racL-like [Saccostrea echinata]|uniref:rho-related protein racL-like n=1 Tax=Saccostrea echinata TaxID=191078 RepID=UPI002A82E02D|nr:rho-related protein racL-like [Saccostrea echinata]